jgi:hypothetical protein
MTVPPNPSPSGYISFPVTIDPNQLLAVAIQAIQAQFPGWMPYEGNLEVVTLEESAAMMSVLAAVASQVPMAIFAAFGQLVGIAPLLGAFATCEAEFTMIDAAGYTIPQGTQISFPLSGNSALICTTVGSFPNGLAASTQVFLQQSFAPVETIETTTAVGGGVDPETITSYINRLSAELQLLAPRPILPGDFAEMAQNVEGVFRACAINGLSPGRVVTDGVTSSGSLVIGFSEVQSSDVGRSIYDGDGYIPTGATIASVNVTAHTATLSAAHAATNASSGNTFTLGDLTNQERCVTVCALDASGAGVASGVKTALVGYLDSKREVNFLVFAVDPTTTAVDVSVTAIARPDYNTTAVQTAIVAAIGSFLSAAGWGGGLLEPPEWNATPIVSLFALADAISSVPGVDVIGSGDLELAIHLETLGVADVTLPGNAPLPAVGTLTVVVNPG